MVAPGEVVQVTRGEYEGRKAIVVGTDGFFYHLQLLTPSGRKAVDGRVSLHRMSIAPLGEVDG